MSGLLVSLLLFLQGITVPGVDNGKIMGILRDASGMPLPRVRVAAMTRPDSPQEVVIAASLVSLAETDEAGRYVLENIPPGRYYITAGRVDFPTYYPGTQDMSAGTIVAVTQGAAVSGIDFVMRDTSVRPPPSLNAAPAVPLDLTIPVNTSVEGTGKLPVFSPRGYPLIVVTRVADGLQSKWPLNSSIVSVGGYPAEYRVGLENLPDGYVVRSLMYGSTNLASDTMKIVAANSQPSGNAVQSQTVSGIRTIFVFGAVGAASWNTLTAVAAGTGPLTAPTSTLSITLTAGAPSASSTGVRVTGSAKGITPRWVYISDKPGTLFSDGTFEFRGVPPGRHAIVTLDNPNKTSPFGAFVMVGNRDLDSIELEETPVLPYDVRSPAASMDGLNDQPPGMIPVASLRGRLVREMSQNPIPTGTVFIVGNSWASFQIDPAGKFEARLLPGKYDLEIQAIGYPTVRRSLVLGSKDIDLDLSADFMEP